MTTYSDPTEDGDVGSVPFLPAASTTPTRVPQSSHEDLDGGPTLPVRGANGGGVVTSDEPTLTDLAPAPFIPAPAPVAPAPVEPVVFDAKAMVESQKRVNANPAYGALPTGTEASREAAKQLRAKAQRTRRRNKRIGWFVGLVFLGGVAAAGWYGYQAYQDEQDQAAIERAENADSDGSGEVDAASPLGQQVEVIDALDDTNSGATASAGGLLDAVDDARTVVGESGGDSADPAASVVTVTDVLPPVVLEAGSRLPDATGRETYVIAAADFQAGDAVAYDRFVQLLSSRPQLDPAAPVFGTFPAVAQGEIVISVEREGDQLRRAIVSAAESQIHVDYTP